MYSFNSRVRYSEVTADGTMDLLSIINYFQDCSNFQSIDIQKGIPFLQSKQRVWLLMSWQILVYDYPKLGDYITIGTWAHNFKGMYGSRNYMIKDDSDKTIAVANSVWIYIDTTTGKPTRIMTDDIEGYTVEPPYPMEYAKPKIHLPTEATAHDSFYVARSNIDTNNHVNNGQYIKMAEEYLPEDFLIYQMRAEYKRQAVLGDIIYPMVSFEGKTCTVALMNKENLPYAIIEFQSK